MCLLTISSCSPRFLTKIYQAPALPLMNDETNVTIIDPKTKSARSHQDLDRTFHPFLINGCTNFLAEIRVIHTTNILAHLSVEKLTEILSPILLKTVDDPPLIPV